MSIVTYEVSSDRRSLVKRMERKNTKAEMAAALYELWSVLARDNQVAPLDEATQLKVDQIFAGVLFG